MRMRTQAWMGVVALALSAACGRLTGIEASSDDAGARDAAQDGAPDGGAASDAAKRFCDDHPGALVCSDFDDPDAADFAHGWSMIQLDPGTTDASVGLGRTDDASVSAPGSLESFVDTHGAFGAAPATVARLSVQVPRNGTNRVRVSFEGLVQVETPDGTEVSAAEIYWNGCGAGDAGAWLFVKSGAIAALTNGAGVDGGTAAFSYGAWHHVVLDEAFDTGSVTLSVDDTVVGSWPLNPPCASPAAFVVNVGLSPQASAAALARYDDVLVEVNPP